jgi:large-conductance mechanosensitive channel
MESNFVNQLKIFITDNNIIGSVAGVCIALATKDVVTSLVGDIVIPIIHIFLKSLHVKYIDSLLPGTGSFDLTNFIKQFISWIFILIITFFFITYAFHNILGITNKGPEKVNPDNNKNAQNKNITEHEAFYF